MSVGKRPARLQLNAQPVLWAVHSDSKSDDNEVSTLEACRPLTTQTSAPLVAGKIPSRAPGNAFRELSRKVSAPQKVKRVFNIHDVIAAVLNGSDIDISGSDNDELDKGQHAEYEPSSSEEQSDSPIGSITVRKGANSTLPSVSPMKNIDPKKKGILWQKKDFHKPDSRWLHEPSHVEVVTTSDDSDPCALLAKYFSHDIFTLLAEETNLRYFTKEERKLKVTPIEMQKFMGICILMGNLNYPRLQMYWQTSYRVPGIADVMTQKRFLTIFANLAATSNQERPRESTNIYCKIAPIIDAVRNACISRPPEENNSIEEQMILFQDRVPGRQYVKIKPNTVGVKLSVHCGRSGMAYDFEFYQGKGTGVSEDHKDLGLGGSIVMRLVENLSERKNLKSTLIIFSRASLCWFS